MGFLVTLHEYSALPIAQRLSTHLFRWTADQMLFTSDKEMTHYGRSRVMQRVIHIGSNVPAFFSTRKRVPTVIYFGQIRPGKGLEEYLELASRSLQLGKPFKYQVIGSVPERRVDYYRAVRETSLPEVEWLIDLPREQVAERMASSLAAYLPFPDGASYRRGSLIATLTSGLPTMTTVGPATPWEMIDVVLATTGPTQALAHLERLYELPGEAHALSCAAASFAEKFSWAQIAEQHARVYENVLHGIQDSRQFTKRYKDSLFPGPGGV